MKRRPDQGRFFFWLIFKTMRPSGICEFRQSDRFGFFINVW